MSRSNVPNIVSRSVVELILDDDALIITKGEMPIARYEYKAIEPWLDGAKAAIWIGGKSMLVEPTGSTTATELKAELIARRTALRSDPVPPQLLVPLPDGSLPPTVTRMYTGARQTDARQAMEAEASRLADMGYFPTSQSWAPPDRSMAAAGLAVGLIVGLFAILFVGLASLLGLGLVLFALFAAAVPAFSVESGSLTVSYAHFDRPPALDDVLTPATGADAGTTNQPPPGLSPATKICPQCAEEVKAAARICRYCRYEFVAPLPTR